MRPSTAGRCRGCPATHPNVQPQSMVHVPVCVMGRRCRAEAKDRGNGFSALAAALSTSIHHWLAAKVLTA